MFVFLLYLRTYLFPVILAFGCLLILFSCGNQKTSAPEADEKITVTDDLGRKIKIPRHPQRIMGLAPSATEMLYAVADENTIIGRTQNCDYPARVKDKPEVNTYPMDYEQLVLLKPDLVFTVEGITSAEVAAKLAEFNIPVYYQTFTTVPDVFRGLKVIGRFLHREEKAQRVVDSLQAELATLEVKSPTAQPKVLGITWQDPIYAYGQNTLFTDKLRYLGAQNAVTEIFAQPYPALTREYILALNPDVLIGGSLPEMEKTFFSKYPELKKIKAYQQKKVFAATDNLMARPGPRVVQSIRELKSFIH